MVTTCAPRSSIRLGCRVTFSVLCRLSAQSSGKDELKGGGIMQATRLGGKLLFVTMLVAGTGIALSASRPSLKQDMIGIERLHEQDKEATLSDSADQLAKLWDKGAIRFSADRPAEVGAAVIYAHDKQWEMSSGRALSMLRLGGSGHPDRGILGIRVGIWFVQNRKGRQRIDSVWQGDEGHEKTV